MGNTFVTSHFVTSLKDEGLLWRKWIWNDEGILNKTISEDVVAMQVGRMMKLSEESREVLKLLSCVRSGFEAGMLRLIVFQCRASLFCLAMARHLSIMAHCNFCVLDEKHEFFACNRICAAVPAGVIQLETVRSGSSRKFGNPPKILCALVEVRFMPVRH